MAQSLTLLQPKGVKTVFRRQLLGSVFVLVLARCASKPVDLTPQGLITEAQAIATGVAIVAPFFARLVGVPADKIAEVQSAASLVQVVVSSMATTVSMFDSQLSVSKIETAATSILDDVAPYIKDPTTQSILQDIRLVLPLFAQGAGLFIASASSTVASPEQRQAAVGRLLALRPRP
jgi:hypothetical protein